MIQKPPLQSATTELLEALNIKFSEQGDLKAINETQLKAFFNKGDKFFQHALLSIEVEERTNYESIINKTLANEPRLKKLAEQLRQSQGIESSAEVTSKGPKNTTDFFRRQIKGLDIEETLQESSKNPKPPGL